jgi:hypothetical protein
MILDPKQKKPSRIGFVFENGKKKRIAKLSGEVVAKVKAPKKAAVKKEKEAPDVAAKQEASEKEQPVVAKAAGKQRFWQKLQFGSAVEGGAPDEARSKQDHTIAEQNIPRKSSGRGS